MSSTPSAEDASCEHLMGVLDRQARVRCDKTAFTFLSNGEDVSAEYTYGELHEKACRIARHLKGVARPGDRALLVYPSGMNFIPAFFGCLYAGVVAVPVNPPRNPRSADPLKNVMQDARPTLICCASSIYELIQSRPDVFAIDPSVQIVVTDRLLEQSVNQPFEFTTPDVDPDSLAFLQYTSGSTSKPKGVMISHRGLMHNLRMIEQAFGSSDRTIGVGWLPHYHDMGLIGNILEPVYLGIHTVRMPPVAFIQKPLRWLKAISQYGGTACGGPNFGYDLCVDKINPSDCEGLDLSSWRVAFTGAEPVRAQTLERFADKFKRFGFDYRAFYPCYGMAETTVFISGGEADQKPCIKYVDKDQLAAHRVSYGEPGSPRSQAVVSCGHAWLDEEIRIVDPESCRSCDDEQIGEIWVRGGSVSQGYWRNPDATLEVFEGRCAGVDQTYLRTGDLGFKCGRELFITGRLKEMLIIRGKNYYPQDIERTVETSHADLKPHAGAAFSVDRGEGEALIVVQEVERTQLRSFNADEIFDQIRERVNQEHQVPVAEIYLLKPAAVGKTSSGKIQRRMMRERFMSGDLEPIATWPKTILHKEESEKRPNSSASASSAVEIQCWLTQQMAQALSIDASTIDITAPIDRYGLDSIQAINITTELEQWLNRPLSPTLIYDYPTVQLLSEHLAAAEPSATPVSRPTVSKTTDNDFIAVVGLSCRFPGADSAGEFWKLLKNGIDAISEVPSNRWDLGELYDANVGEAGKMNTRWGGFLKSVDGFDADYFGISPREARKMDPQQRMILEVAREALDDAGWPQRRLRGTATGVYMGISHSNYQKQLTQDLRDVDAYSVTGTALSIAANRLSYLLDLRGPSLTIDTACSSSLVAVHQACQSLRTGEINAAIVGGANVILSPEGTVSFSQARMMAADGRCKTFSAGADGYSRGEGCGVLILKRLSEAQRDGDMIRAVIRGSAINQDGLSNGLTAPNGPSQQAVIQQALKRADVAPADVSYVEAHGTGTELGDPIEMNSIQSVYMNGRPADKICRVGSVKTNIGHLESAAGIAGLIKIILSMEHETVPAHLHLKTINPLIKLSDGLQIPTQSCDWPHGATSRLAGVSSFGFGGTNAHVIVEEGRPVTAQSTPRPYHIFLISAKSSTSLDQLVQDYQAQLINIEDEQFADWCVSAAVTRDHYNEHRVALVVRNRRELMDKLDRLSEVGADGVYHSTSSTLDRRPDHQPLGLTSLLGLHEPSMHAELCAIANEYCGGAAIDWDKFYADIEFQRQRLPVYPFTHSKYWFSSAYAAEGKSAQPKDQTHRQKRYALDEIIEKLNNDPALNNDAQKVLPHLLERLRTVLDPDAATSTHAKPGESPRSTILDSLSQAAPDARLALMTQYLRELIAQGLEMPVDELDVDLDLNEMGIDSIMAMELRARVNEDLQVNVHILELLVDDTTVVSFAEYVMNLLEHRFDQSSTPTSVSAKQDEEKPVQPLPDQVPVDERILDQLDSLSEDQIDELLSSIISDTDRDS